MATTAPLLSALALVVIVWLLAEVVQHRRALGRIGTRVHVNGTRGKSSVTRLIAAGLRAGGKRVVAKSTGTLARVILPNERELAIYRPMGANVREQIRVVRFTARLEAEILVVECMALQPILQWLSERVFVRATHGVITNARPDHLDVMGPGSDDVARALCGMVPRRGVLFTAEREHLPIMQHAAEDRRTKLVAVTEEDVAAITQEDMRGFSYYEHSENVALALEVCGALGVSREVALEGMRRAQPDPGALTFLELQFFGRELVFVNAFAANDPISSQRIYDMACAAYPDAKKVCLFNCRLDRADRSSQLGTALASWAPPDQVLTIGSGTIFFSRAAQRAGFDVTLIENLEGQGERDVFERLLEVSSRRTLILGLGNIGGVGLGLVRLFKNRATLRMVEA